MKRARVSANERCSGLTMNYVSEKYCCWQDQGLMENFKLWSLVTLISAELSCLFLN